MQPLKTNEAEGWLPIDTRRYSSAERSRTRGRPDLRIPSALETYCTLLGGVKCDLSSRLGSVEHSLKVLGKEELQSGEYYALAGPIKIISLSKTDPRLFHTQFRTLRGRFFERSLANLRHMSQMANQRCPPPTFKLTFDA